MDVSKKLKIGSLSRKLTGPEYTNIAWLMFDRAFRLVIALLIGALLARHLGPSQFGQLNYTLAILFIFSGIAAMGMQSIVVRNLVLSPESSAEILSNALVIKILGALVCVALMTFAAFVLENETSNRVLICVSSLALLFRVTSVIRYWYEATVLSKYVVWVEVSILIFGAFIRVFLVYVDAPLVAFVWTVVFESALVAIGMIGVFRVHWNRISQAVSWKVDFVRLSVMFKDAWPLVLAGLAISLYMRVDQIMIGQILDQESVGIYSVAVQLSELWYFVPVAIVSSVFPGILRAKERDSERYSSQVQDLYNTLTFMSIVAAIFITVSAVHVVNFLYGVNYADAANILMMHVWGGIFVAMGVARGKWLVAENLQRYSYWFILMAMILNIAGNLLLIPLYGIAGAAFASLVAQFVAAIAAPLCVKPVRVSAVMLLKSLNPLSWVRTLNRMTSG